MKHIVTLFAVLQMIIGLGMLFVPDAFLTSGTSVASGASYGGVITQLLGAAFIGFGAANWIARAAPLGGIYGRAVVVGNQAFSLIGSLILLTSIPTDPPAGFWLVLLVLVSGAILHGTLLIKHPASAVSG